MERSRRTLACARGPPLSCGKWESGDLEEAGFDLGLEGCFCPERIRNSSLVDGKQGGKNHSSILDTEESFVSGKQGEFSQLVKLDGWERNGPVPPQDQRLLTLLQGPFTTDSRNIL